MAHQAGLRAHESAWLKWAIHISNDTGISARGTEMTFNHAKLQVALVGVLLRPKNRFPTRFSFASVASDL